MTDRVGMLAGDRVFRVHWLPGTDTLLGICHCGAERATEEPVALWDWLLAHPAGHQPPPAAPASGRQPAPPPRVEVPV